MIRRLGDPRLRTRTVQAAVCSDLILLRTPFFLAYALGRFSYSFSWMFLVCQISQVTFKASRKRRATKQHAHSLPPAAANVARCIRFNLHVLIALLLAWLLGK